MLEFDHDERDASRRLGLWMFCLPTLGNDPVGEGPTAKEQKFAF